MEKQNSITLNTDFTTDQTTLSNPVIGSHTLKLLDGLKESFWDTVSRIERVKKATKIWDYQKTEKLNNLYTYKTQLESQFNFWSELVKKWVSDFPEKYELYGDIIVEYYCDINNYITGQKEPPKGALSLQDILDEFLYEETDKNKQANNFKAKIRKIALNLIESKK